MIMKRLSKLFVLSILFFTVIACKKKDLNFIIEGTVSDVAFQTTCNEGKIKLYKVAAGTSLEVFVAEESLSNGQYSFTFERDRSEKYVLRFERENYFEENFTIFFSALKVNEPYIFNFNVDARAYITWIVTDVVPQSTQATCSIVKLNGRTSGAEACPNGSYDFIGGSPIADTLRCAVRGNEYIRFNVVKLPSFILDSVYCPAFEDVQHFVNY